MSGAFLAQLAYQAALLDLLAAGLGAAPGARPQA